MSQITKTNETSTENIQEKVIIHMWGSLEESEKEEAYAAFWKGADPNTNDTRKTLQKKIAETLRFRPVFIERAPLEKKIGYLKQVIHRKPFCYHYDDFIRAWLVQNRLPLIIAFMDAASIPHKDGFATEEDLPTVKQFDNGIKGITGKFQQRDITLYLCYLAFYGGGGFWDNLIESPEFQVILNPILEDNDTDQMSLESDEENEHVEVGAQGTTQLDDLLIRLTVATAFGEENAPNEDTLEDIIEEIVELNAGRQRSLFHRGFFHALFDRDFSFSFSGENTQRRQWYTCGVIFGLLRKGDDARCVSILSKEQKELGNELATSHATPCGAKLLPLLLQPLLQAECYDLVARFVEFQWAKLSRKGQMNLRISLFNEASKLLRCGRYAESEKFIDLIIEFAKENKNDFPQKYIDFILLTSLRRKAQCQQAKGSFGKAKEMLDMVVESGKEYVPPNAVSDQGLIEGGFRSLAAVLPKPTKGKNQSLIDALKKGVERYNAAIDQFDDRAVNAHLCMGILKTLDTDEGADAQERADHLQHALGGMREQPEAYDANDIRVWTEFLLVLALLETAEPSNYQPAEDLLPSVIKSSVSLPLFLWERLFDASSLFDDPGIAITTARHLLEKRPKAYVFLLDNAELLVKNEPILIEILTTYLSRRNPVRKIWKKLSHLLPTCLEEESLDAAELILDQLEKLAGDNPEFRPDFIDLLIDSDHYSPVWDASDVNALLVDLLEMEGHKQEAAERLREQFYQLRSGGHPHEVYAAREVLTRLSDLGPAGEFASELATLLPAEDSTVEEGIVLNGKVLYIGGNETQERYVHKMSMELNEEHPELDVQFHFPGWTSNWNVYLDKLKPLIDEADVVVINSLIRTQLGRHLRAYCNADHPWLPCTGRGFDSLKASIIKASAWAAKHRDH